MTNNFDATNANADPGSIALSDEVYSALGVIRDRFAATGRPFPVGTLDAMNGFLLVLIIVVIAAIGAGRVQLLKGLGRRSAASLADAKADARRVIERLGGQVLNITGTDDASKQAMADASERYTAASSQIDQATTARQAALAKESALEGLYYVRAARTAMGMDPGPELESLTGQRSAGTVTEDRRINFEGREIEASPTPSERTPNYYPGGRVAGRPVPAAGTRSRGGNRRWSPEPGVWARCSCSSALFSGMHGVGYGAQGFEHGYGEGYRDGYDGWRRRAAGRWRRRRAAVTAAAGTAEAGMAAAATSGAATSAASATSSRVGGRLRRLVCEA